MLSLAMQAIVVVVVVILGEGGRGRRHRKSRQIWRKTPESKDENQHMLLSLGI